MNRYRLSFSFSFFFFVGILSLSGCSFLGPQNIPEKSTYTFAIESSHPRVSAAQKITLFVSTPSAGPGYESRKMIYTNKPFELSEFAKSQWAAPPAEMLGPILIQKLRNTGYFHAVLSNALSTSTQVFLRTHLIELRQDFTQNPSRLKLAIQAELIQADEHRVINSRTFTISVPASENTPYGGVVAANRAVDRLVSQITEFSVSSLKDGQHESKSPEKIKIRTFKSKKLKYKRFSSKN